MWAATASFLTWSSSLRRWLSFFSMFRPFETLFRFLAVIGNRAWPGAPYSVFLHTPSARRRRASEAVANAIPGRTRRGFFDENDTRIQFVTEVQFSVKSAGISFRVVRNDCNPAIIASARDSVV